MGCGAVQANDTRKFGELPVDQATDPQRVEVLSVDHASAFQEVDIIHVKSVCASADDAEDWAWSRKVLSRYDVRGADVLGIGNFSVVRRGFACDGEVVAVKMIKSNDDTKFRKEVFLFEAVFEVILSRTVSVAEAELAIARGGVSMLPPEDLFVQLLDHSPLSAGANPNGECVSVLELGAFTLHDLVAHCSDDMKAGRSHCLREEGQILRVQLHTVQALQHLHSRLLVHGDFKPANVMWFKGARSGKGSWKLIDLDGLLTSAQLLDMRDADFYTPIYAAPELAAAVASEGALRVSRRLDIWAAGITTLELEILSPPLWPKFEELCSGDGGDSCGLAAFMTWLGDTDAPLVFPSSLRAVSPEMIELLRGNMLVRNPAQRRSPTEILEHDLLCRAATTVDELPAPSLHVVPAVVEIAPRTAWQLYQEEQKPALEQQGLTGRQSLLEMHKQWKAIQAENGPEFKHWKRKEVLERSGAGT